MDGNCKKIKDEVADFVSGVLNESAREFFASHLAECECCRAYLCSLGAEEEVRWAKVKTLL